MLLTWLSKKWLYYRGVRFYESKGLPSNSESIRTQFTGTRVEKGDIDISFEFYREVFKDMVFKRGKFISEEYHVFLVRASFKGRVEESFLRFNDTRLMCKNAFFPFMTDEVVADVLQGLYIAYLKKQLE